MQEPLFPEVVFIEAAFRAQAEAEVLPSILHRAFALVGAAEFFGTRRKAMKEAISHARSFVHTGLTVEEQATRLAEAFLAEVYGATGAWGHLEDARELLKEEVEELA